ncbi:CBS domain protein [compost metagenome]
MIKSMITKGGFTFPGIENTPGLHPEQLVVEALKVMLDRGDEVLPVVEEGQCIGLIYVRDLVRFLHDNAEGSDLFYHKLNFDLRSAVISMHRQFNASEEI